MRYFQYISLIILSLMIVSCGGGGNSTDVSSGTNRTSVVINIGQRAGGIQAPSVQAIPSSSASSIVIRASDNLGRIVEETVSVVEGMESVEVVLMIPNGLWHFEVFVYDGSELLCYGDAYAEIAGIPITITINVVCMADEIPPVFNGLETAEALSETSVELLWFAAEDDVTPPSAIVYLIYISPVPGEEDFTMPSFVTPPGATTFILTDLSPSTAICAVVRAKDEAGNIDSNTQERCATTFSPAARYTLTVTKSGDGDGTVTSNPSGINCGGDCSETYDEGQVVHLIASEEEGSIFDGWGGHLDCWDGVVTMDADKTCKATFNQRQEYTLTVIVEGYGYGTVTSNPSGIDCVGGGGGPQPPLEAPVIQNDCSGIYDEGTVVTLTATPDSIWDYFNGWSGGGCSGFGTCEVTMNADTTVTATFDCEC